MKSSIPFANTLIEINDCVDISLPVRVYRNLNKSCLSVQQKGIVKCHTANILLYDFRTVISRAGQKRVREQKRKNVHAFIEGNLVSWGRYLPDNAQWVELYYNPYKTDDWQNMLTGEKVTSGRYALISSLSVRVVVD